MNWANLGGAYEPKKRLFEGSPTHTISDSGTFQIVSGGRVKFLPLDPHHSVHVEAGQGSRTAKTPNLQSLKLVESLVKESGKVSLITG
jgi:hypothetical protein